MWIDGYDREKNKSSLPPGFSVESKKRKYGIKELIQALIFWIVLSLFIILLFRFLKYVYWR